MITKQNNAFGINSLRRATGLEQGYHLLTHINLNTGMGIGDDCKTLWLPSLSVISFFSTINLSVHLRLIDIVDRRKNENQTKITNEFPLGADLLYEWFMLLTEEDNDVCVG